MSNKERAEEMMRVHLGEIYQRMPIMTNAFTNGLDAAEVRGRKKAINNCIAALNKLIDEIAGKEFHPDAQQVLFLARDALRALLVGTPAKKKDACVEHLWERQEDGFVHCINLGCGVSKEAYTTGSVKAKEKSA